MSFNILLRPLSQYHISELTTLRMARETRRIPQDNLGGKNSIGVWTVPQLIQFLITYEGRVTPWRCFELIRS
jgi:hypothetical protein